MPKRGHSNQIAAFIGAVIGVIAIHAQPDDDGNLLVTTVCALIGGTISLVIWIGIKKLKGKSLF